MMTAIRALDFYKNVKSGKSCNEQVVKLTYKKLVGLFGWY